jgi:hypothetical protein
MILRVQYKNGKYDYVNQRTLDALIKQEAIEKFYRSQEKKWVNINIDPIRRKGSMFYFGVERRQSTL